MAPHVDQEYLHTHVHPPESASTAKDLFAGTMGGIAQVLSGQPFDTTKVRLQSAPEGTYSGAMDVVRQLLKNEGFMGFYKGTLTPLVGVGACVSVQFSVNEYMKRLYGGGSQGPASLTYGQLYASGGAAGFANAFLASPIEQIRIRLQTQTPTSVVRFDGPIDAARKIIRAGGIAHGLFRGLIPTIVREIHGMGMYFLAAEACVKQEMRVTQKRRDEISSLHVCAYGAVGGLAMWTSVYPVDVLKSRIQVDALDPARRQFSSLYGCYKATVVNGYKSLFKGFGTTMLRAAPVNAVTFLAFDATRKALGP